MMTFSILCFFLHFCVFISDNLNVFKRFLYLYVFFICAFFIDTFVSFFMSSYAFLKIFVFWPF